LEDLVEDTECQVKATEDLEYRRFEEVLKRDNEYYLKETFNST
jgi:hypothetical protein